VTVSLVTVDRTTREAWSKGSSAVMERVRVVGEATLVPAAAEGVDAVTWGAVVSVPNTTHIQSKQTHGAQPPRNCDAATRATTVSHRLQCPSEQSVSVSATHAPMTSPATST
jgi:hypothetical protein